jgi:hypothetical protein
MAQSKHFNVPGLTELENAILKEDPLNMISFLQVKYSNNHSISQQLNQYIDVNGLSSHEDDYGYSIVSTKPFYTTDNEYMVLAIETDNITLFEPIFTYEVQKVMPDNLEMQKYVLTTLNDCINHDAYSCIKHITENDYTIKYLPLWLVNTLETHYWFPAIARYERIINLLFIDTSVIDHMEPLERNILGCMITESAIRTCNTEVFKWCISTFWRTIDYLSSEYAKEPYLNENHLKIYYRLTGQVN